VGRVESVGTGQEWDQCSGTDLRPSDKCMHVMIMDDMPFRRRSRRNRLRHSGLHKKSRIVVGNPIPSCYPTGTSAVELAGLRPGGKYTGSTPTVHAEDIAFASISSPPVALSFSFSGRPDTHIFRRLFREKEVAKVRVSRRQNRRLPYR